MRKEIRKTVLITASLTLVASVLLPAWRAALWVGALWGLLNVALLIRCVSSLTKNKNGLSIAFWLAAKFLGLYGLLFYLLVGLRISPWGWLIGFTLGLAGLSLGMRKAASIDGSR